MLEKNIEAKVSAHCTEEGILQQKLLGQKGCNDRIYFLPWGGTVLIEFKKPGGKTTRLQKHTHTQLQDSGHHVYICKNADDAIIILNFWRRTHRVRYSDKQYNECEQQLKKLRKIKVKK